MFIWMVFDDFDAKDQLLTILPLRTTMRGVDIYNSWRGSLWRKRYHWISWYLWLQTGLPPWRANTQASLYSMQRWHRLPNISTLQLHHSTAGDVWKSDLLWSCDDSCREDQNGIRSKAKQIRTYMVLLEELSSEYGDLSLLTEMWWLSRGQVLQCICQ